jgi:peptide/nickel transport system permease protein
VLDVSATSISFTFMAFPSIIGVIAVLSFWMPRSLGKIILVVGITSIPLVYRVMRAATLSAGSKEYVTAARVMGAKDRRILFRELLPNVAPTGLSFLLFGIATVIALEGVLAFLGLSITPDVAPSWGNMINESRDALNSIPTNWGIIIFPSLVMFLFILSLNLVGDRLRSYFDVTEVKL